jgi:lysophospholipase L1-like esterase
MNTSALRRIAGVAAFAFLAACGGSSTKIDKLATADVVLAFGDSLTFGTGAKPDESYPAVLERTIARKVANGGIPGETSEEGLRRLPQALDEVRPRLLILCHGGNDFLRRLDERRAAQNIRAMIRLARERGIAVVLIAIPKPGLPPSIPAFYGEIAAELRLPFEDVIVKSVLFDASLKSDMVHPNARGYERMAAAVEKVLRKSGAL